MENQNQNGLSVGDDDGKGASSSLGVVSAPPEYNPDSLSLDPTIVQPTSVVADSSSTPKRRNPFSLLTKRADAVLAVLLILTVVGLLVGTSTRKFAEVQPGRAE